MACFAVFKAAAYTSTTCVSNWAATLSGNSANAGANTSLRLCSNFGFTSLLGIKTCTSFKLRTTLQTEGIRLLKMDMLPQIKVALRL